MIQLNFGMIGLGAVDNTAGGSANLRGTLNNAGDTLALSASTGNVNLSGGVIVGGTITEADGAFLNFLSNGNNRLDGATLQGDLNLNTVSGSRVRLLNGADFTGDANLGTSALLAVEQIGTLDNTTINLDGTNSTLGISGTNTLTLGPNAQVNLNNSNARLGSDVHFGGTGTMINQGTITADATVGNTTRTINPDVFENQNLVEAVNSSTLNISAANWSNTGDINVLSGSTVTFGGSWNNTSGTATVDGTSTLNLGGTSTTAGLGTVDNSAGGTVNITGTLNNTGDILALDATTGSYNLNGGVVVGGTITEADGAFLNFLSNGNNRLDGATLQGDLNLNTVSGSRVRLLNGADFTGDANLGTSALLAVEQIGTLDNTTINLDGTNSTLGISGTNTLTLGPNAQVNLNNSNARLGSDVHFGGTGTIVNQGTITADATVGSATRAINPDVFENQNLVEAVNSSTLNISATNWSNTGDINVLSGSTVTFGGTWNNASGTATVDGTSTLNLGGTSTTAGLGTVDNTAGGMVNITGTLNNTGDILALDATTGSYNLNGGVIVGGTITEAGGAFLHFLSNGNNRLDGATLQGDLNLNTVSGSRVRLLNGADFTGDANLGTSARLAYEQTGTLDNTTINLDGTNSVLGISGTNTLILGPNAQVNLNNSNARLGSDVHFGGTGTMINQGTITADATVGSATRTINPDVFENQNLVEAVNSSTLNISATNWSNTGDINVLSGSTVTFGGTWNNASGTATVDGTSTLNLGGTSTTAGLGTVDNTAGGMVNITGTLNNTGDILALDASTGSYNLNGGVIVGGTITEADGAFLNFLSNGNNRLDGATLQGDLNLNTVSGSRVRLLNGADFTGDANLGTSARLAFEQTGSLDNTTINLDGTNSVLGVSGTNTLTLGPNAQVNLNNSNARLGSDVHFGGTGTMINQGTVTADATVGTATRTINPDVFENQNLVEAVNGAVLNFPTAGDVTNHSGSTLTGGTWAVFGPATMDFDEGNIATSAAEIILSGAGSSFTVTTSNTPLEAALVTNAAAGALRLLDGRNYTASAGGSFVNAGIVELGGGTFDAPMLDNQTTGEIFGFGTITPTVQNSGLVRAAGGTLTAAGGVQASSGTVQIDAGSSLDLSSASSDSSADLLIHNGNNLNLGANDFMVSVDYTNANFGTGNSFDHRANVSGAGQIQAAGDVTQQLTGDVTGGDTATPTLDFGDVHVGVPVTLDYQIANAGTSGPSLRGAIQTSVGGGNLTDSRLTGSGVTASNYGPLATGGDSGNLEVTFDATIPGVLVGQTVHITNNFDNVASQLLGIDGTAWRLANPDVTPTLINFGNVHVDEVTEQTLTVSNDAPDDGASELLNASFGGTTGGVNSSGSVSGIPPQGSDNTSMTVSIDTTSAGDMGGTATVDFVSDGTGLNSLGQTPLGSQVIDVSGSVYRLADPTDHMPEPVVLPNAHIGDSSQQVLSITNQAANDGFSESLNASFGGTTGDATAAGSFNLLGPGATDNTNLVVGVDTSTAGSKSGTATLDLDSDGSGTSELGVTALASQTVNISGDVYRLAQPSDHTPEPVVLPNVHVGDSSQQVLSMTNQAANDGFSESLNASFGGTTGDATASGSFNLLGPGATDNTNLVVGIDTSTAGSKSGTATLDLESDGSGTSELGITALASQTVNISGDVYRLAQPSDHTPEPVSLGNRHLGEIAEQALSISNLAPNDGFSESLNASFSGTTGDATASGSFSQLLPGGTDNSSLVVGLDTSTVGPKTGTAIIALESDGTGSSGLGITALPSQTVIVNGSVNVFRLADPTDHTPEPVVLPNVHVGDLSQQVLSMTNQAANDGFSESLNASFGGTTGDATASGSFNLLGPGATDNANLVVGIDTSTAGSKSGTATLELNSDGSGTSELGVTALASQTVNISGDVYRLAQPSAHTPEPVDLGIVHVGDVAQQLLTISNQALGDGFSESLNGAFSGSTGDATASGSFSLLAPGATSSTDLVVGIDTSTAGAKSGTATIGLESDGTGSSELGTTVLAPQTVNILGQVNDFADPLMQLLDGVGVLTQDNATAYTLDLGTAALGDPSLLAELGVLNNVAAPADELAGDFTIPVSPISFTGFDDFVGLLPTDTVDGLFVELDTSSVGTFGGQIFLDPRSENASGFSGGLPQIVVNVTGVVTPEPTTLLLLGIGATMLPVRRRRTCRRS